MYNKVMQSVNEGYCKIFFLNVSAGTLHSRSKIPININEDSVCHFTKRDAIGKLIQKPDLLIIDEISMGHKSMSSI